ncbi:MAG: response regulator transcription factor [Flavobacteriales bacterium]|nr:response regulator transcription factor [Flavobacteriales bacterium]MCB9192939.1 response regulator transcription factor [Flavobacteriales bacterium]
MRRILLIEDDKDISDLVRLHLTDLQYEVEQVFDGNEGLARALEQRHCLIVLDLMLPGLDGISIGQRLRKEQVATPILMLTSRAEEIDKVIGLETGADDYLTKPFSVRELLARVKALLRRMERTPDQVPQARDIDIPGLRIDTRKRAVEVHGQRVDLTPKEYELLLHLAQHPGVTFTREELLAKVWGHEYSGYEHTVNSHINRLRNKVERTITEPEFILTTWGVGYRFTDA